MILVLYAHSIRHTCISPPGPSSTLSFITSSLDYPVYMQPAAIYRCCLRTWHSFVVQSENSRRSPWHAPDFPMQHHRRFPLSSTSTPSRFCRGPDDRRRSRTAQPGVAVRSLFQPTSVSHHNRKPPTINNHSSRGESHHPPSTASPRLMDLALTTSQHLLNFLRIIPIHRNMPVEISGSTTPCPSMLARTRRLLAPRISIGTVVVAARLRRGAPADMDSR